MYSFKFALLTFEAGKSKISHAGNLEQPFSGELLGIFMSPVYSFDLCRWVHRDI